MGAVMRAVPLKILQKKALEFKGRCCVYELRWDGKSYIGSTTNLKARMAWWIYRLSKHTEATGKVLVVCEEADREHYEAALIALKDTFVNGHNKTPHGKSGVGKSRHVEGANYNTVAARKALAKRYADREFVEFQGERIAAGHAAKRAAANPVKCRLCGAEFKPLRRTNYYCSDKCKTSFNNAKKANKSCP